MVSWNFIREVGPLRWALRYGTLQFRKQVLRRDSELRLPTGAKMVLPRQSQNATEIYVTKADIDWGAETIFLQFADPERDFLDIGSHIGYYAAYLAPRVRCAYAFEPDSRNIPGLRENARLGKNIEVIEMAVSSRDGSADFFMTGGSSTSSLCNNGGSAVKVFVTTVDTFVAEHPGIDVGLIKTDVEGHDLEALRGMQETVTKFQPLILTECELSAELADLCSRWNYRLFSNARDRQTQKIHVRELNGDNAGQYWSKMLFLVPELLQPEFAKFAGS
jgi:FkbM family methyltransferase